LAFDQFTPRPEDCAAETGEADSRERNEQVELSDRCVPQSWLFESLVRHNKRYISSVVFAAAATKPAQAHALRLQKLLDSGRATLDWIRPWSEVSF
jgi:hypothetical protein